MSHDAELDELFKRFQALQRNEVPSHISERNVVEIVNVLMKRHLVDLLYTTDAKEYLTWEELKKEIVDEVWANEGRLNVVDLPGLLSAHTHQVERVLPEILQQEPSLRIENGEFMTDTYLSRTVQSLEDSLKEQGFVSIAQFASTNRFSSVFAKQVIEDALRQGQVSAVLEESMLYTTEFVSVQKRMLRACLLAQHQPVDVKEVMKRNGLFAPLAEALMVQVAPQIPGTFNGHIYIPTVFESFRTAQVENIYKSNGFVEYSALQSLGLSNPKQYLRQRFNDPVTIGGDTVEAQQGGHTGGKRGRRKGGKSTAATREVAAGGGMAGGELVRATAEYPLCGYALSACFLSDRFLNNMVALGTIADKEVLSLDISTLFPSHVTVEEDWPVVEPRLRELFPGLSECELIEGAVLLHKDAEGIVRGAIVESLANGTATAASGSRKKGSSSSSSDPLPVARAVLSERLALPEETYEAVLDVLMDQWSDMIEHVVEEHKAAGVLGAAAQLRQSRVALQTTLAAQWVDMSVAMKGVQWAEAHLDAATHTILSRHLLSTLGYGMLRDVLSNESLDSSSVHEAVTEALSQVTNANQLTRAVKAFPSKVQPDLTTLVNAVNGKSVDTFVTTLQDMSSNGTIAVSTFHQPNKKVERDAYAKLKDTAMQRVMDGSFGADEVVSGELFASVCTFLVHTLFRVHLVIPGKAVGAIVERLTKEAAAPKGQLEQGLQLVTTALQSHTPLAPESIAALEELRAAALQAN